MTQSRKRAIWSLIIWVPVSVVFVILFFFIGSPESYIVDQSLRLMVGLTFAIGFLSYGLMMYVTRVKVGAGPLVTDERDDVICRQGATAGMICVLVYVFVLAIGLWEGYQEEGAVPVGWMWFLAYSTTFLAYIGSVVATLILHGRSDHHG